MKVSFLIFFNYIIVLLILILQRGYWVQDLSFQYANVQAYTQAQPTKKRNQTIPKNTKTLKHNQTNALNSL